MSQAETSKTPFTLACIVLGVALILDSPGGRAFYNYEPWTETVGRYFFASFSEAFGVSGVSVSLFEFLSILLAFWYSVKPSLRPTKISGELSNRDLSVIIFVMLGAGVLMGFLAGNDFGLMLTQTRAIFTLPFWLVISANCFTSIRRIWVVLGVIAGATLFKALQGLWCFYVYYGGQKGEREYLIEHVTSEFLGTSILFVLAAMWRYWKKGLILRVAMTSAIGCYVLAFLLNDRRSALVGIAMGLGVIGISLSGRIYWRYLIHTLVALLASFFFLAATWNSSGALGFPARTIKSLTGSGESSAGYRKVENANMLLAVASQPITGIGFGRRITMVYPLPDISGIYSEYDLVPHNTLLFVWTFAGPLGLAAFAAFCAISIGYSLRLFRLGTNLEITALGGMAAVILIKALAYIYADLGLREVRLLAEYGVVAGYVFSLTRKELTQKRIPT